MTGELNLVSIAILISVSFPLLIGLIRGISAKGIVESILSLMKTIEIIFFLIFSIYLTKNFFFVEESRGYKLIFPLLPQNLKETIYDKNMIAYMLFTPIILIIFLFLYGLIITPIYTKFFTKIGMKLQRWISKIPGFLRHFLGLVWNIPKAIIFAVILGLGMNIFGFFTPNGEFNNLLNNSSSYEKIYEYALIPILHGNFAKRIPLILNNTFAFDEKIPEVPNKFNNGDGKYPSNVKVIHYFNGVTLDEAVKSDEKIDSFAKDIIKSKVNDRDKAKLIYKWISSNIVYDEVKAKNITSNPKAYNSGAKEAFYAKKGICFDFASLYVAMCRANKMKVSLVTGVAYNGIVWGDHAWNRSFLKEENSWINVDTTFGKVENYFDRKDFYSDHKYEKIREEWK